MTTTGLTVTSVSDEGDSVVVRGYPDGPGDEDPIGVVFQAKLLGDTDAPERASRLAAGDHVTVTGREVTSGWIIGTDLSVDG